MSCAGFGIGGLQNDKLFECFFILLKQEDRERYKGVPVRAPDN